MDEKRLLHQPGSREICSTAEKQSGDVIRISLYEESSNN